MATASRQPTYVASDPVINGKPSVKSSSSNGQIGLSIASAAKREKFMVAYFNDGVDNNFGGYFSLFSGPGTDGQHRMMGQTAADYLNTGRSFDAKPQMNGHADSAQVLPMPATVLKLSSSSTRTEATNLLFAHNKNDRGWVGGIGEMIVLSSTATWKKQKRLRVIWPTSGVLPIN